MQIQNYENNNTNFKKNSFLMKAKNAPQKLEKRYWESLHNEAKARLNHHKYMLAEKEFCLVDTKELLAPHLMLTAFLEMAYRKFQSFIYLKKALNKFPNRFIKADNSVATEKRFYKAK